MEVVRIAEGPLEVAILPEVGARIHRLRAYRHDLLRTPDETDLHRRDPFFWGAYVMAPWGGRIEAAPMPLAGRVIDPPANFPDGSAIHGQLYARPWEREADTRFRVRAGGDGWPWTYEATLALAIEPPRIAIELAVTNMDDAPMPAGLGLHPWFRRPLEVAIAARSVFASNVVSAAEAEPVSGRHDLRSLGSMADGLDATWTDIDDPPVELSWPTSGLRLAMRVGPTTSCIVAASPPNLDAIAVEPQTHGPQGLRRLIRGEPGGLALLAPGQTLRQLTTLEIGRS
jgi:aldose 1-epimerase